MDIKIPRLLFAAPRSGSGKTLVTCGFLEAVKKRGHFPASFKCGPDYIDPMFHKYVLGVSGTNLDSFFLDEESLCSQLAMAYENVCGAAVSGDGRHTAAGRYLAVIEGVMGYYDGLGGTSLAASTYEIARITDTPTVLVVDCKGASLSLAALVSGFLKFTADSGIEGVILNRISQPLYEKLVPAIEKTCVRVYGYLPENKDFVLESRHLGLMMPGEVDALYSKISAVAAQMEATVDLDGLLELSESPSNIKIKKNKGGLVAFNAGHLQPRIGVARDEAFSFYYQENLKLMEELGAELIYFSPLHDKNLPEGLNGILLGGGYPENYAGELSENKSMMADIKNFCMAGMPVLAECGGFLYLHKYLEGADGIEYPLAGVVDGRAYRTNRLGRFGYVTLTGPEGIEIKGHEYHYWDSTSPGDSFQAVKPGGGKTWPCIHQIKNLLCGFPHLYYPSNPYFIERWLQVCGGHGSEQQEVGKWSF